MTIGPARSTADRRIDADAAASPMFQVGPLIFGADSILGADLMDLVQESVIAFDLEGRIVAWNVAAERLYGWERRSMLGQSVDLLGPESPLVAATRASVLTSSDHWDGDLTRNTADGRSITVQARIVLRRGVDGRPVGIVETGVDVTAQRSAEHALRASEERYRNLFHAMPASFWEIDFSEPRRMLEELLASGVVALGAYLAGNHAYVRSLMRATRVLDVNDRSVELYRLPSRHDLLKGIHHYWPDDCTHIFARAVVSAADGEPFFACETKQLTLDGREFDALFTASYPPELTAQGRLIVNIVDNSEIKKGQAALREREVFYRNVFHASTISMWQLDASNARGLYAELKARGVTDILAYAEANPAFVQDVQRLLIVADVNDTTLKLFGASDRSDIVGRSVTPFWIPGRYETLLGSIAASYRNAAEFRGETRMRTLDGRDIDVLFTVSATPELRAAGQAMIGIVDITDRVSARTALAEMQTNFAHAARVSLLGELTASIAHEVNQPLAAITTNGEAGLRWLNQSDLNVDELRLLTQDMISDARRASDIITRIRAMASPQAAVYRRLSINDLVREAMLFLAPQLKTLDVAHSLQLQPGLPDVVGDAVQLQQIVVNLVLNAVQAMESTVRPRLELSTSLGASGSLLFDIQDNGPGVRPEDAGRLFDTFFTTKRDGMGIGLAICRSIVEAHGGTIGFADGFEVGARFFVWLPVGS